MHSSALSRVPAVTLLLLHVLVLLNLQSALALVTLSNPIRLDCGAAEASSDRTKHVSYDADQYYLGGAAYSFAASTNALENQTEYLTLRAFAADQVPCYKIPLNYGRYVVRIGVLYANYDGTGVGPSFFVLLGGAVVDKVVTSTTSGVYTADYVTYTSSYISVCFQAITGKPIINTLEILPAETTSFRVGGLNATDILRTVVRINSGGPAIPEIEDPQYRTWSADNRETTVSTTISASQFTKKNITIAGSGASGYPDYLPSALFKTARTPVSTVTYVEYSLSPVPVGTSNYWLVRCHFAEIYPEIKNRSRLMDVRVYSTSRSFNVSVVQALDLFASVGLYTATSVGLLFQLPGDSKSADFTIRVSRSAAITLQPILSGLDIYEVIDAKYAVDNLTSSIPGGVLTNEGHHKKQKVGTVIIIVVIVVVLLLLCVLLAICLVRRRKDKPAAAPATPVEPPSYVARVSGLGSIFPNRSPGGGAAAEEAGLRASYEKSSDGVFK